MTQPSQKRRQLIKSALAGTLATTWAVPFSRALGAPNLTIGVVYVGPKGDFGWNSSHAAAIEALKKLPGVTILEEERVPETRAVMSTMESMIQLDDARLILGTSYGYFNPFMVELARKYPNVQFRHPTTLWASGDYPKNLGGYFCSFDQSHYINGIAAGLSTISNKLGYVAAKPIPLVLRTINAFLVGARMVNPNATVHPIFTGDWSVPVREAEATNALINAGCDVIATHVDSPKVVIETAERRNVKSCGHNTSQASLAPKGFVTGSENKYETVYRIYAQNLQANLPLPNMLVGGYEKDMVRNTPFGAGATEAARNAALTAIEQLKQGKPIFQGPLKDNKGNVVINKTYGNLDPFLENMNYLLDGVVGTIN